MLNVSEAKSHIIQATRPGEDGAVSDSMFKNNFQGETNRWGCSNSIYFSKNHSNGTVNPLRAQARDP